MESAATLILLILPSLICVIAMLLIQNRAERRQARMIGRLRRDTEALQQNAALTLSQMNALSDAMEERQARMNRTLDERMEMLSRSSALQMDQVSGRLSESFKIINANLEGVHRGLGEMNRLSAGVGDLKRMLGNVKTRGIWGEVQLRAIMEEMFTPEQYAENIAIPEGAQTRVEFALRLPTGALLPIDSKFPQEDYLRLIEASAQEDRAAAEKAASQLERALIEQAKRISDKYIRPPQTVNFAVMFLPVESLYAEAARRGDLLTRLQDQYRVLTAGPSTLCALLTSLRMGIQSAEVEQHSAEVLAMLDEFRNAFEQFEAASNRMRQRLNQTEQELDALQAKAKQMEKILG